MGVIILESGGRKHGNKNTGKQWVSKSVVLTGILLICPTIIILWSLAPILPGNEGVWNPVWSPNGQDISFHCLFISWKNVRDYLWEAYDFAYNRSVWGDICLVDPRGGNFRRLTSGGQVSDPAWSPDGKFLAWLYGKSPIEWGIVQIWNRQTLKLKNIILPDGVEWGFPEWSKDGKKIFLQDNGGIIDIATGHFISLPPQPVHGEAFSFTHSPDGNYIIYKEYPNWKEYKYRRDRWSGQIVINSAYIAPISFKQNCYGDFSLSPDGEVLAYPDCVVEIEHWYEVFTDVITLAHFATGKTVEYRPGENFNVNYMSWSPDGSKLVFTDSWDIRILTLMRRDKGDPISIVGVSTIDICEKMIETGCSSINGGISWSPDGQYLIVGINNKLWIIKTDGKEGYLLSID